MSDLAGGNVESKPTRKLLFCLSIVATFLVLLAALFVALSQWPNWPNLAPTAPENPSLERVVEQTAKSLLNADHSQLKRLATNAASKSISDSYEFEAFLGYKGTFDDYLRFAGNEVTEAAPRFITRSDLGPGLVQFRFCPNANPEGITLAFRRIGGHWKLAYFSLGEIDPEVVKREAMK